MQYPGAQKKPFDIITSIKLHCQSTYFFWKLALGTSFEHRFTQYLQSNTHSLVYNILSREIHLPSPENVWQIPAASVFPMLPASAFLATPLEVHATSYFAASDNVAFSCNIIANHNPFPSRNRNHDRTFVRIISPGPYPVNKHCPANCFLL